MIGKLDGVRKTGNGRWVAKCPAHDDRKPSLALRQVDDGRVLVHCFSGCSADEILVALGVDFSTLFPERTSDKKPIRRPFSAADALRCVAMEATLVAVTASNLARGTPLAEGALTRMLTAAGRINHALDVALS